MNKKLGWFLFFAIICQNVPASTIPKIKVLIAKDQRSLMVEGTDLVKKIYPIRKKKSYEGHKAIRFDCIPTQAKMAMDNKPILVAGVTSKSGLVSWNKNHYRGELMLLTGPEQKNCDLVNELSLDAYISSLLAKEMHPDWPIEALKAQAVAARSYAYHKMKTKEVSQISGFETYYDVENSEKHQVTGSFFDETIKTNKAANDTAGEVLVTKKGAVVPIFFHSKCGGMTYLPHEVWGGYIEAYRSVPCAHCQSYGKKTWSASFDKKTFFRTIKEVLVKIYKDPKAKFEKKFLIAPDRARPELTLYSDSDMRAIRKSSLRDLLGRERVPSNNYRIVQQGNKIELQGMGNGHGVGMCQFGALEMAKKGFTYKQILSYYFPNFKLTHL